jgi:2'-5' RNA ligase
VVVRFRAFISADIEPSEQLVDMLRELQRTGAALKTVKPRLMHVTLKFLGDTDEALVDDIAAAVAETAGSCAPFTVRLKGMGAFPSMSNIRVVWVGMEDGGMLSRIASGLDDRLLRHGFAKDDKGFKPHLTVARAKNGEGMARVQELIRQNAVTVYGEHTVDSILLKKSVLGPHGPVYSTIKEVRLPGP